MFFTSTLLAVTCMDSVAYTQCIATWNTRVDVECNQKLNLTLGFNSDLQTANREGCLCIIGAERNTCYDACTQLYYLDPNLAASEKAQGSAETNAHCAAANSYKAPTISDIVASNSTSMPSNVTDYIKEVKNDQNIQDNLKDYARTGTTSSSAIITCFFMINGILLL